jgi:ribosomal protein L3 glutamine methyltransferase
MFFVWGFERSDYNARMIDPKNQPIFTLGQLIEKTELRFEEAELSYGHGTTNAFDEAAFLALEGLGLAIDGLEEFWTRALSAPEQAKLETLMTARITTRKPASYLVNRAYIQGIPFYVDERVIVPRSFIAEILAQEDGFSRIGDYEAIQSAVDICTGSGCLAVLATYLFPNARVDAVELSDDALAVAQKNFDDSEMASRLKLYKGDLFGPLKGKTYDLIITNPPYVDRVAMEILPDEYRHEPAMALAGGNDGMDLVRRILRESVDYLTPDGGLLCEVGRGRDILENEFDLPFLWIDTEDSEGEVFWLTRAQLAASKI